ncbi:MAG: hypothetical protein C5B52_14285 [Bacteroidetes bacterium]|nr:MAG: hypothetical protein C5B52_14285 [Bacteroidota bacterium]
MLTSLKTLSLIRTVVFLTSILFFSKLQGQTILNNYLKIGLENNLALKQKGFDLERARLDLKRAQTLFFPQASINSQYLLASGGRTQDLPVGDLLNGVYSTLNQLTASNKFPQVTNQSIKFLPNNYQDTRMEITLPVVNTDIKYNRDIKKEWINSRQADIDVYKRDLVKNIKQSYYQFLQSAKAVSIFKNALSVVRENLRVSEKFVQNNMATKEIVLRAQAQVSQVETSVIESTNNMQNATAYFNFLINQPLETPIEIDSSIAEQINTNLKLNADSQTTREELLKLRSSKRLLESKLRMDEAFLIPTLNAFYNVGYQGYGFKFNSDQFYQLGGLQLRWNIFKAGDNKYKVQQSRIDIDAISNQYNDVVNQLNLEQKTAFNNYASSVQSLESSNDEVQSSRETYRLAERRFKEGKALQIELIDARTQMTRAELKYSLAQLAVLSASAEVERVNATYKF